MTSFSRQMKFVYLGLKAQDSKFSIYTEKIGKAIQEQTS